MADEIKDALLENAQGPKRAQGDQGSVEQHSLPDQIAAAKFAAASNALKKPNLGLNLIKIVPPGTA